MKSEEKSFERPPDAAEEHGLSFFTPEGQKRVTASTGAESGEPRSVG